MPMVPSKQKDINSAKVQAIQFHVLSLQESNDLWASINHIGHLEVFLFGCLCGNATLLHIFGELHQNGC